MVAIFIILGIFGWFILGIFGYIIQQKYGEENVRDDFGLFFAGGGLMFVISIVVVSYEYIRNFITDRY